MALAELYTLPIRIGGASPVRVIAGEATAATDNEIDAPNDPLNTIFLVGQSFVETSATNATYKSGDETIVTMELAANQGLVNSIDGGVVIAAEVGKALKINPSVTITSGVFFVVEARSLVF